MAAVLRGSVILEQRISAVRTFRDTFKRAHGLLDSASGPLGDTVVLVAEGNRESYEQLMNGLGELSGAALAAAGSLQTGVTRFGRPYNPILQWRDAFEGGMASATDVVDSCDTIIGALHQRLLVAKEEERTLAFRIGWAITLPHRVRASVATSTPEAQRFAFWGAVMAQVVGGAVILALSAALAGVMG